jgi:CheY-like chemotaxis protein
MKPVKELEKPSVLETSHLFANINILIVDRDNRLAVLIKRILFTLGCKQIHIGNDGLEAINIMREEPVDIIICALPAPIA